ncbi:DNA polymerase-4 [Trichlorobacter thiogenes]|uniref:DNA polymerase IV n=1 Tax=Trichlorobacter thiogenes TaxID=115783 RepID=A0A1T4LGH2_9BACT|nr:DNA polymerase IV [Trichlorobacter thiogenes]SJZ53852.1 DNA polymerase-4 [Trichlorobacter thiogenes]
MDRVILHIDMNAFFASVEQQANPDLRGKPVAVVGSGHRTVITTSSYEARSFGVKTGMAIWEGKRACPELIIVVGDNKKYTDASRQIIAMMRQYTPLVEVFSIDEAFLDVTHSYALFGTAETIAHQLKTRIRDELGLTCSVGIAPNKLLAKLASDMQKPDGLTVIAPDRIKEVLESVTIGDLCGIGRKLERQLNLLGIKKCGQLGRFPADILSRKFGIIGPRLRQMGQGIDNSPVVATEGDEQVKSIGHSMTLGKDIDTRQEILRYLLQLSEMVGRRARRYGVTGRTVSIYVRFADFFTNIQKQTTLNSHINQSGAIYKTAVRLLDGMEISQPVRLLGVCLSNLEYQEQQPSLFAEERRQEQLARAMDAVNDRFGDFKVTFGSMLDTEEKGSHVISPAWRPEGIRSMGLAASQSCTIRTPACCSRHETL